LTGDSGGSDGDAKDDASIDSNVGGGDGGGGVVVVVCASVHSTAGARAGMVYLMQPAQLAAVARNQAMLDNI
jgi:hypothetical protein